MNLRTATAAALLAAAPLAQAIGTYERTLTCERYYIEQCYDSFRLTADRAEVNPLQPLYLEYDVVAHTRGVDAETGFQPGQGWSVSYDGDGSWDTLGTPYGHIGEHVKADVSWLLEAYPFVHGVGLFTVYGHTGLQWVDRPDNWWDTVQSGDVMSPDWRPWYYNPQRVMIANMTFTQPAERPPLQLGAVVPHAPEPGTWALMLAGLAACARLHRRRA
jgi:hypothetical protein